MPSWTEKSHTIPSINVNLSPCDCERSGNPWKPAFGKPHAEDCAGFQVLVPLSLEPWRSVTMTVRMGECTCGEAESHALLGGPRDQHLSACPARPIRVTCYIGGDTWDNSKPVDFEVLPSHEDPSLAVIDACRALWALVKALVLGHSDLSAFITGPTALELLAQRDALYASLTDMARHESGVWAGLQRAFDAFPEGRKLRASNRESLEAPSAIVLAGYVQRLIEQVQVMP